jgi:hypothetical protein
LHFFILSVFSLLLYCVLAVLSRASVALHFPSIPRLLLSISLSRLSLIPLTILFLLSLIVLRHIWCYICNFASPLLPTYFTSRGHTFDRSDCSRVHLHFLHSFVHTLHKLLSAPLLIRLPSHTHVKSSVMVLQHAACGDDPLKSQDPRNNSTCGARES